MSVLYENIQSLCERKGISGYKMCKDIGMSTGALSSLKSGRKKGLSADLANRIAVYFGVSVGDLLGETQLALFDDDEVDSDINVEEISGYKINWNTETVEAFRLRNREDYINVTDLPDALQEMLKNYFAAVVDRYRPTAKKRLSDVDKGQMF